MRVFGLIFSLLLLALPAYAQQPQSSPAIFTSADVDTLVRTLQDGLEGHNLKRFLSAFDREQMIDYGNFADQVSSLFARTDAFRVNLHVTSTQDAGNGRVLLSMDAQMEIAPRDRPRPDRRESTLSLEVAKSGNNWRIVQLAPRDFFY
jgi:hypothetical protein